MLKYQYLKKYRAERGLPKIPQGRAFVRKTIQRGAPSVKKFTKAVIKSKETGFVDLAFAQYACDTTGIITLIATVAQGAGTSSRVGKKIMLKSLQARGEFIAGDAQGTSNNVLLIVYDRQPQGALPAITDILNTANSRSFNDDDNASRFKILKRMQCITIGENNFTVNSQNETIMKSAEFFLDLKDLPTTFKSAATGAIADIETGALYAVTVGNIAAGTSAGILGIGYRTRYWDA